MIINFILFIEYIIYCYVPIGLYNNVKIITLVNRYVINKLIITNNLFKKKNIYIFFIEFNKS